MGHARKNILERKNKTLLAPPGIICEQIIIVNRIGIPIRRFVYFNHFEIEGKRKSWKKSLGECFPHSKALFCYVSNILDSLNSLHPWRYCV